MTNRRAKVAALILAASVWGCGGAEESPPVQEAQQPDTLIKPLEREPLTEADFAGLDSAGLVLDLPWTENRINRNPAPAAPRSLVMSAEVSTHDGFDRMVFTLSRDAPFPGYSVELLPAGAAIGCGPAEAEDSTASGAAEAEGTEDASADGEQAAASDADGPRVLVLRIRPGRTAERGRTMVPDGTKRYGFPRIAEAGVTCTEDEVVTWVAELEVPGEVRVLEFRDPYRLVVDVR